MHNRKVAVSTADMQELACALQDVEGLCTALRQEAITDQEACFAEPLAAACRIVEQQVGPHAQVLSQYCLDESHGTREERTSKQIHCRIFRTPRNLHMQPGLQRHVVASDASLMGCGPLEGPVDAGADAGVTSLIITF